jgi:N-glycosylase/DNA lyase
MSSDSDFQVDKLDESVEGKWKKWGNQYLLVPINRLVSYQKNLKLDTMFTEFCKYFCAKHRIVYMSNMDTLLKPQWLKLQETTITRFLQHNILS